VQAQHRISQTQFKWLSDWEQDRLNSTVEQILLTHAEWHDMHPEQYARLEKFSQAHPHSVLFDRGDAKQVYTVDRNRVAKVYRSNTVYQREYQLYQLLETELNRNILLRTEWHDPWCYQPRCRPVQDSGEIPEHLQCLLLDNSPRQFGWTNNTLRDKLKILDWQNLNTDQFSEPTRTRMEQIIAGTPA